MPYCPKCGIQTEINIKKCPLCNIEIPQIVEDSKNHDYINEYPLRFPVYKDKMIGNSLDIKKRTFYAITVFLVLNMLYLILSQVIKHKLNSGIFIITFFIISAWIYLLIFFGFIQNKKVAIFILIINTFFFMFLIDLSYKGLGWFIPVFVPAIVLGSIILIITATIIRLKKEKSFNIIFDISISISIFLIGIESIISRYLYDKIFLSWSIFLSAEIIISGLLLMLFYYKIPSKLKNKIKMKLHF